MRRARPAPLLLAVCAGLLAAGCGRDRRDGPLQNLLPLRPGVLAASSGADAPRAARAFSDAAPPTPKDPASPIHLRPGEPPPPADGSIAITEGGAEFLDPARISDTSGGHIGRQIFESLLLPGLGAIAPRPGQAESWTVSPDGRTYTFRLRPGLSWSDGAPLGSADFLYGWRRALEPATASRAAQLFWVIEGAKAYNEGKTRDFRSVGIRAPDPRTFVVRLAHPAPYFPAMIAEVNFAPTPRRAVERWGDAWTRPEHVVVNGAYLMTEHRHRDRIVLLKNPRYWDAARVRIPKVIFYHTESETTELQWYETGKTQKATNIPNDRIEALRAAGREDLRISPYLCTYYFVMNMTRPPFDDLRVRRAFDLAIDKERLIAHILKGGRQVATHLVHASFAGEGYRLAEGEAFAPERARTLLAEAGYPGGSGFPKVELLYNTYEGHRVIAEYVQRNLKENLGLAISIQNMEWKSLLKKVHAGDYQMARTSWCVDYPDPLAYLEVFVPGGESNYSRYRSEAYAGLLKAARLEPDRRRRVDRIYQAEAQLNRDLPIIPLYFYTRIYLLRRYVLGHPDHITDSFLVRDMRYAPVEGP